MTKAPRIPAGKQLAIGRVSVSWPDMPVHLGWSWQVVTNKACKNMQTLVCRLVAGAGFEPVIFGV